MLGQCAAGGPPLPIWMGHPSVFTFYFKELDICPKQRNGPWCQLEPQLPVPSVSPAFEATAPSHLHPGVVFQQAGGPVGVGVKGRMQGGVSLQGDMSLQGDTATGVGASSAQGHTAR